MHVLKTSIKGDFENLNGRKDLSQTCIEYISNKTHSNLQELLFLTVFLSILGRISVWQEKSPNVVQCFFNIPRELWISDMAIHRAGLLLISREGFAFHATHQTRSALNNQVSSEQDLSMKKQHIAKNTVSCPFHPSFLSSSS